MSEHGEKKEIAFTKTNLPYGWLGNMSPHSIKYGEYIYRTAEALFQALRFSDALIQEAIREERSPMGAKMVAKCWAERMVVQPRSKADLGNMRAVLRMKLEQHEALLLMLVNTREARLIEDCTARRRGSALFWGAAREGDTWVGENWLGRLWMELRAEYLGENLIHYQQYYINRGEELSKNACDIRMRLDRLYLEMSAEGRDRLDQLIEDLSNASTGRQ